MGLEIPDSMFARTPIAGTAVRRPDAARLDVEPPQQIGDFALRDLVRGLLVVAAASVEPLAIIQLNQLSLEGQAADAIKLLGNRTLCGCR